MRWGYVFHVFTVAMGAAVICHLTGLAPAGFTAGTVVVFFVGGDILQRRWLK